MAKQTEAGATKKHLNEGLGLEVFDYQNMKGEMYKKYVDLVYGKVQDPDDPNERRAGGLNTNKMYVFDVYHVTPREKRLYPKSNSDRTMIADGFELMKDKPVMTGTKTTLKYALELNSMLYAKIAGSNNNPIQYFLLQQPK